MPTPPLPLVRLPGHRRQRALARWMPRRPLIGWTLALVVTLTAVLSLPATAWASAGETLFQNHCAGCHLNGGNILRRSKTLKLAALQRQGIDNETAIARIAANGIGQMDGYADRLGEGGPEAVAAWVWNQAQAGWPRS